MSADESSRRHRICAEKAGTLEIEVEQLDELAARPLWANGDLRLDLLKLPGTTLSVGSEYASVVPAPRASLDVAEYSYVEKAFKISRYPDVMRLTELCTALSDQVVRLAENGDLAGAQLVQAELLSLLRAHVLIARGDAWRVPGNPPSPAVVSVVSRTLLALNTTAEESIYELCVGLIRGLLVTAGKSDPVILLVAARGAPRAPASLNQLTVLYEAGRVAIVVGGDSDVIAIQARLHQLLGGTDDASRYADETAARLVQYAAVADPSNSRRIWTRYRNAVGSTPQSDLVFNFSRIGAAALRVGNYSLAVEVALALPGDLDLPRLRGFVHNSERAERENILSRLYGRLLGHDAETHLDRFVAAAEVFRSSLPDVEPAA
jgi:hypothetical protein